MENKNTTHSGIVYKDAPMHYDGISSQKYRDYVALHENDPGFDKSIYSINPKSMY